MQGLYLDSKTQGMTVELITYNADLRVFANILLKFEFGEGGSIDVKHNIYTLRVEMYSTVEDLFRQGTQADLLNWLSQFQG